jgi:hypothetical protein
VTSNSEKIAFPLESAQGRMGHRSPEEAAQAPAALLIPWAGQVSYRLIGPAHAAAVSLRIGV